jgi:hypothetical protein
VPHHPAPRAARSNPAAARYPHSVARARPVAGLLALRPAAGLRPVAVGLRALLFALVCAGALVFTTASPAAAHGADAPTATDYQVTVGGITPALPGLSIRTVEAGARLELVNHSGVEVEVLGYSGEPYLLVKPDGVWQNANSTATYVNESLAGGMVPPATAGPAQPPAWQKISDAPAVLWHDQRTHWTSSRAPSDVLADPRAAHHLRDWTVPLRSGVRTFAVTGSLDYQPPPSGSTWWAGCLLLAGAVAALGLRRTRPDPSDPAASRAATGVRAMGAVALAVGLAALGYALGVALDSGGLGAAGVVRAAFAGQTWPVVCGLAALLAGGYALARRPAADLALGLAGACVALFAGFGNAAVFAHAVVPSRWPGAAARSLVLLCVAGGVGLAVAVVLRLRAGTRRPVLSASRGPALPAPSGSAPGSAHGSAATGSAASGSATGGSAAGEAGAGVDRLTG